MSLVRTDVSEGRVASISRWKESASGLPVLVKVLSYFLDPSSQIPSQELKFAIQHAISYHLHFIRIFYTAQI
jgi:hypothetical protein